MSGGQARLAVALRVLRRSPAFALTTVLTIALGIGASTALFSVVDAVLLRPLPYADPDRLVIAYGEMRKRGVTDLPLSGADFVDLRASARTSFEDFAAVQTGRALVVEEDGTPLPIRFASITPNFLRLLGGRIALGRDFVQADGEPRPAGSVRDDVDPLLRPSTAAILSDAYWQRRYGGRVDAVGGGLLRSGGGARIVGVLAPDFELLFPPRLNVERWPEVWVAARLDGDPAERRLFSHRVVGRLKEGARLETGRSEVETVAAGLRAQYALWETTGFHVQVEPMGEHLVAQTAPAVRALMGAATFLLLIACANVLNLFMVRASLRERELATRVALGASRWDLAVPMLAEALALAALGTLLGIGMAQVGIWELTALAPTHLPRLDAVRMRPVALLFAVGIGAGAALVLGVVPALRAARRDAMQALRGGGRTAAGERASSAAGWSWRRWRCPSCCSWARA